jgi:putative IMPACT (imprinted ancient) family translation regulator
MNEAIEVNKNFTLTIKKSKFLAFSFKVNSELEAKQFLADLKKQHHKARHIVYTYRILENNQIKESR